MPKKSLAPEGAQPSLSQPGQIYFSDKQVADRFGITRVTVWRWRKNDPTFPAPIQLSPGCVRFRLADLEEWEAAKAEGAA